MLFVLHLSILHDCQVLLHSSIFKGRTSYVLPNENVYSKLYHMPQQRLIQQVRSRAGNEIKVR